MEITEIMEGEGERRWRPIPLQSRTAVFNRWYAYLYTAVLPNLCAAAHKCAARASEVYRAECWKSNVFNEKF